MKKLLLSMSIVAVAVAVQAGDAKPADAKAVKETKDAPACCATKETKAKTTKTVAAKEKSDCCSGGCKDTAVKQALLSPKDAAARGL